RQKECVERRWVVLRRDAVVLDLVRIALEHPAVDEHLRALCREKELRAGHGRGGTEELQLHVWLIYVAMFGPVLKGERVTLRPADDHDPPRFLPWIADMEVTRYLGRRTGAALYQEVDFFKKVGEAKDTVL